MTDRQDWLAYTCLFLFQCWQFPHVGQQPFGRPTLQQDSSAALYQCRVVYDQLVSAFVAAIRQVVLSAFLPDCTDRIYAK